MIYPDGNLIPFFRASTDPTIHALWLRDLQPHFQDWPTAYYGQDGLIQQAMSDGKEGVNIHD